MSDEFLIKSEIMTNERIVSVSLLARYLYFAMILLADQEGRAPASSLTWKSLASLWGAAEISDVEIAQAIKELHQAGLIVLYDDDRRLFLPGRFEHNRNRKWWKSSKHPLPPLEVLARYPEYLNRLRCLTTRGHMYETTDEARRYPELRAEEGPTQGGKGKGEELGGNKEESTRNQEASGIGVGVGVDIDNMSASRPSPASDGEPVEIPYSVIIAHLNEKAGTRFRASSKHTLKYIRARWGENYRLIDFLTVIDNMTTAWIADPKMRAFLRPQTLFGSKFESYLNSNPQNHNPIDSAYQPFKEDERDYEKR